MLSAVGSNESDNGTIKIDLLTPPAGFDLTARFAPKRFALGAVSDMAQAT